MYIFDTKRCLAITHEKPGDCLLCKKSITIPCIFWMSPDNDVWLHPDCAASMVLRLARDVHEHKLRSGLDIGFKDSAR